MPASVEYTCLENCPISLACGYNLESNPPAIISWSDPQGRLVENNDFYTIDNGPKEVQLNICNATRENNGTWKCSLTTKFSNATNRTLELYVPLIVIGKLFFLLWFYNYHSDLVCM